MLRVIVILALAAVSLRADPIISEFMASNQHSITDEDGDHSDWIEILNPDATPVNMAGWGLTDKSTQPLQWVFPSVTIPAHSQIIVWASGKNRKVIGANLHTNFSLSANGEYLALVKPDGVTKTTEYNPTFPPQVEDVSYGVSTSSTDTIVVSQTTSCRSFVPTDNSLGVAWHVPAFNDSAWTSGTFAVGYMDSGASPNLTADLGTNLAASMSGTGRSAYTRVHFNIANPALVTGLKLDMKYDDGFYAWINNQTVANSPSAPAEASLAYNSTAPNHTASAFETFDLATKLSTLVTGDNVIAFQCINTNATSSDAFLLPQLTVTTTSGTSGITGYFTTATPGAANGGTNTLFLPITVAFSKPSGTFTTTFNLTLSGAGAGQEIRYNIVDPSSTASTVAEPTISSTKYTAPISIATSKIIRASVFETSTGRKGLTTSAQYLLLETGATNNTSNFTSNLPLLVVDDHGAGTPVDSGTNTYTTGFIHIFPPVNGTASLNTTPTVSTRAGMRVRGSSSASFAKKSLGVEFWDEANSDKDLAALGLSADSDWILNGPYQYDLSYIHNSFIYEVSRRIGRWAPRTKPVETFFNTNGGKLDYSDYNGIYMFTEKIKSNSNRLDITGIKPEDIAGDAVTGGYIFKNDRIDTGEVAITTTTGVPSSDSLVIVEPDPDFDNTQQITYIGDYVRAFDSMLLSEKNAAFATRNYLKYIDRGTWIDHHILNSLAYNVDALRLSAFFYKDRNSKICAGPIWDFDRSLNTTDNRDDNPSSWGNIEYFFSRDWWGRLFQDPDFVMAWVDRWQALRAGTGPLSTANLLALIDQQAAEIGNAAAGRDAVKWTINAPKTGAYTGTTSDITAMKTWLTTRLAWIDAQMPAPPTAGTPSGVVSAGSTVTLAGLGADTVRYTTNGTDPRPVGGAIGSATPYSGPITITQTTVITARRQTTTTTVFTGMAAIGSAWSGIITRVYLVNESFAAAGDVVVDEINYHPLDPSTSEIAAASAAGLPGLTADDFEFVELKNVTSNKNVNLFECKFLDTQPFKELVLAPFTLHPGEVAFVVKNRAAFQLRYGTANLGRIVGEWGDGSLDNNGEHIVLNARDGSTIQDFNYNDSGDWPGRPDGKGSSLEYRGATFTNADFNNPVNWRASSEFHGSPGTVGTGPDGRIAINEILSNTQLPYLDAIELKNLTAAPMAIGGWYLSNVTNPETADSYKQYAIPAGTTIGTGGYSVFDQTQFNPNGLWNPSHGTPTATEFEFDGLHGGEAWLLEADGTGKLVRFVDHVDYNTSRLNESWGRTPDGTGNLYPLLTRTCVDDTSSASPRPRLGAPNSIQRSGPLVLSEVHHSPAGGNTDFQFVEIRNTGNTSQALFNWRLRGAVDFDFTSEVIPAGGLLTVVPFPATDSTKLDAFRAAFLMATGLPVLGPWSANDHLDGTDTVTLYRAEASDPSDPYYIPRTIEDMVTYTTTSPWANATGGFSLTRRGSTTPGADPTSWKADVPTPGTFGVSYTQWLAFYFPGGGAGSNPTDDPDLDGASNTMEYARGSNPTVFENYFALNPTMVRTAGANAAFVFTFTRPVDRPGASYAVFQSTDLLNWSVASDTLLSTVGDLETHQVTIPINGTTPPSMFFRLQISVP